ncbi:hypothetical protein [Acetobacter syzygii]|uniref:Uncharacterized protein n=1 Tax=Acetobacter syzygii TaxID=146476 RepID=A0A270BR22_9PROT|nr:hypothetical protein [Acetobacter syzygii]PAL27294.1 hypothetical protein B9K05_04890 [Acetobacter syzygii]PAL27703.1 hypothetical protein B9K04_02635 [Acetobacter syzygii]
MNWKTEGAYKARWQSRASALQAYWCLWSGRDTQGNGASYGRVSFSHRFISLLVARVLAVNAAQTQRPEEKQAGRTAGTLMPKCHAH